MAAVLTELVGRVADGGWTGGRFEEIDAPQLFQPDGSMKVRGVHLMHHNIVALQCNICAGTVSEKLANLTDITASGLSKDQALPHTVSADVI